MTASKTKATVASIDRSKALPPPMRTVSPVVDVQGHRQTTDSPQQWLAGARSRAAAFREEMLKGQPARYFRSFRLVRAPYPTRYAFLNATTAKSPFIHIVNRLFVVQYDTSEGVKTLLVSPTDVEANAETPFFKRLGERFPTTLRGVGLNVLAPTIATVEECLAQVGLSPSDVDYITYDHLHTQDLRRWLGTHGSPGYFPNAKLLVMAQEWESVKGLLPTQQEWYCPDGVDGIDPVRVEVLAGDTMLGDSVAILATPGHTEGNHSIVVHAGGQLYVTSENGVGPDAYAPEHSEVPGVAAYARATGAEVVLNGNTLEGSATQYVSMVVEKTVAGEGTVDPKFPNMLCSSEFEAFWAFPGIRPTVNMGEVMFGAPVRATGGQA